MPGNHHAYDAWLGQENRALEVAEDFYGYLDRLMDMVLPHRPSDTKSFLTRDNGGNMADKISLADKLATFEDLWSPRTVTTFNDCDVMVVKVKGEFTWHKHDDTDDFFLVLKGNLDIELRDRTVRLGPGELYVVPKGVEHRPVAREEVHLLLIEPTGTPNTGDKATAAARKLA